MTTAADLKDWRDLALAALAAGPLTPQQLGDRTAVGPQSAIQRARKFPNTFKLIERPGSTHCAKAPIDRIDLDPGLRRQA